MASICFEVAEQNQLGKPGQLTCLVTAASNERAAFLLCSLSGLTTKTKWEI